MRRPPPPPQQQQQYNDSFHEEHGSMPQQWPQVSGTLAMPMATAPVISPFAQSSSDHAAFLSA